MTGYGASVYQKVSVFSGVTNAEPHQLVLMLFDGAIEAARLAGAALASGDVAAKGRAIGRAVRIVDEGLKASLDTRGGGPLAVRLQELYGFITMRLLQGNLRNDPHKLEEAAKLLGELRAAWSQIKPAPAAAARAEAAARVALAV